MTCAYCRQETPLNRLCDVPHCQDIRRKARGTHTLAGAFHDMEAGAHADKYFFSTPMFRVQRSNKSVASKCTIKTSKPVRDVNKDIADFRRALMS